MAGKLIASTSSYELRAARPITERIRYDVTSHLTYEFLSQADPAVLKQWLALPQQYNPRTLALAAQIRRDTNSDPVSYTHLRAHET